jgi:hypothetical protein
MTIRATVIEGKKGRLLLLLDNGARLEFRESDTEGPIYAGDQVLLDTERDPSIRKASKGAASWNPVHETKISGVEETKALIESLELGDEL